MKFSSLVGHIVELLQLTHRYNSHQSDDATRPRVKPADRIVAEFFRSRKYLGSHDRRFIAQNVYSIIRFRRRIAVLIRQYATEHPSTQLPSGRAAYILQFIAHAAAVEEIDPQQIINIVQEQWHAEAPPINPADVVFWMVQNKSLSFLNGDDIQQLADWYSFEDWMVRQWVHQLGLNAAEDLLHAFNGEASIILRVNPLKTSVEACQRRLNEEGIETNPLQHSPTGLVSGKRFNTQISRAFQDGWYEVQDEGSQIICYLVEPQPGQFIIDACAGTGGKSLMLGQLMQNKGEILAFDTEQKRLRELDNRLTRAGINIIVTRLVDRLHPGDLLGKADRVLVDAPCSGIGTLRRNPWLKWSVTPKLVESYAQQQTDILETYGSYVKQGGRLIYATCSLFQQENEHIVEKFLRRHSEFEPVLPVSVLTNLGIAINTGDVFVNLLPHRHGTDGFFVAVLTRKG